MTQVISKTAIEGVTGKISPTTWLASIEAAKAINSKSGLPRIEHVALAALLNLTNKGESATLKRLLAIQPHRVIDHYESEDEGGTYDIERSLKRTDYEDGEKYVSLDDVLAQQFTIDAAFNVLKVFDELDTIEIHGPEGGKFFAKAKYIKHIAPIYAPKGVTVIYGTPINSAKRVSVLHGSSLRRAARSIINIQASQPDFMTQKGGYHAVSS